MKYAAFLSRLPIPVRSSIDGRPAFMGGAKGDHCIILIDSDVDGYLPITLKEASDIIGRNIIEAIKEIM